MYILQGKFEKLNRGNLDYFDKVVSFLKTSDEKHAKLNITVSTNGFEKKNLNIHEIR